jgi:hypothetical protein
MVMQRLSTEAFFLARSGEALRERDRAHQATAAAECLMPWLSIEII